MLVAIETGVAAAALLLEQGNLVKGIDNKTTTKGHLISEQICEEIDFPKLQRKYC